MDYYNLNGKGLPKFGINTTVNTYQLHLIGRIYGQASEDDETSEVVSIGGTNPLFSIKRMTWA